MYACTRATKASMIITKTLKPTHTGLTAIAFVSEFPAKGPKKKIRARKESTTRCPPVMVAKSRIISAAGFRKSPVSSMRNISGQRNRGTCGTRFLKNATGPWATIPPTSISEKVMKAMAPVTKMLAVGVTEAGVSPITFMNMMKKKTNIMNGRNLLLSSFPMAGSTRSSRSQRQKPAMRARHGVALSRAQVAGDAAEADEDHQQGGELEDLEVVEDQLGALLARVAVEAPQESREGHVERRLRVVVPVPVRVGGVLGVTVGVVPVVPVGAHHGRGDHVHEHRREERVLGRRVVRRVTMGQETGADQDGQHCQRAEEAHDALSSGALEPVETGWVRPPSISAAARWCETMAARRR